MQKLLIKNDENRNNKKKIKINKNCKKKNEMFNVW